MTRYARRLELRKNYLTSNASEFQPKKTIDHKVLRTLSVLRFWTDRERYNLYQYVLNT